jgi:hypothetical protein
MADGDASKVQCIVCREDIRAGAMVCTQCKNPQNWARHVVMWKDLGTATLALVPLWGGAIALWTLAFKEPTAAVRAIAAGCDRSSIVLALSNEGEAAAVLKLPTIRITRSAQTTPTAIELRPEGAYPYLLPAKQSQSVTLKPRVAGTAADLPTTLAQSQDACSVTIDVRFQGFNGKERLTSANCQCPGAVS